MARRGLSRRRFLRLTALSGLGAAVAGTSYVSRSNMLEVTRTRVAVPGVGPSFTLALIADVHAPQRGLDFGALVNAANSGGPDSSLPDVTLIVGDSFNRRSDVGLVEMFAPLVARHGVYATAGNWENWARVRRSALGDHYRRAGVALLDNAHTEIPDLNLKLIGLDERTNGRPDWSLLSPGHTDLLTVLLHHSPGAFDFLPTAPDTPLLMLSGHSHGGQIAPFGRPIVVPPGCRGYIRGLYARGSHSLYVTRGVGNMHVPIRVGSRPELALLSVRRTGVEAAGAGI